MFTDSKIAQMESVFTDNKTLVLISVFTDSKTHFHSQLKAKATREFVSRRIRYAVAIQRRRFMHQLAKRR